MPSTSKIKSCGRRKRLRYFESTGDLISRKIITSGDEFNHNQVHTLLISLKSHKSLAHFKILCEPDGIRLKRTSKFGTPAPRKFYAYKDIEHYYVFDNDPTILILGCIDREQKSRYYDFFKLPESHYKDITTLIDKARSHSDYVLNEDDTTLPTPAVYSSHSSLNLSTEHLSQNNTYLDGNSDARQDENNGNTGITENDNITRASAANLRASSLEDIQQNADHLLHKNTDPTNEVIIHNHYENHEDSVVPTVIKSKAESWEPPLESCNTTNHLEAVSPSLVTIEPQPQLVFNDDKDNSDTSSLKIRFNELKEKDETFAKLSKNMNVNDIWAMDFRYVTTDPESGNRIADDGDIYIFIAHFKRPENIKNLDVYDDEDDTAIGGNVDPENKKKGNTADKNFCLQYI
ncbi:unnamed protein product [Heterobilharzia americana]|nr:unnamed protein product [Heterobilharzia americana]